MTLAKGLTALNHSLMATALLAGSGRSKWPAQRPAHSELRTQGNTKESEEF